MTKEQKEKIRQTLLGKKHSEETKKKMSESAKGRIVSQETKDLLSKISFKRGVLKYTKKMVFICEYNSILYASKETNIPSSNICKCCKNELKTAGGFIWKYTKI